MVVQIRDMARSKGPRRFRKLRSNFKPVKLAGNKFVEREDRLQGMYEALKERGWTFRFTVTADSPHGFKSMGAGASPQDALSMAINGKGSGL